MRFDHLGLVVKEDAAGEQEGYGLVWDHDMHLKAWRKGTLSLKSFFFTYQMLSFQ